jgi:hypothetical protein
MEGLTQDAGLFGWLVIAIAVIVFAATYNKGRA